MRLLECSIILVDEANWKKNNSVDYKQTGRQTDRQTQRDRLRETHPDSIEEKHIRHIETDRQTLERIFYTVYTYCI